MHWTGMSKEEIISRWHPYRRHEGYRFEEIIQEQKELLEKTIVANIKTSAIKGDTRAFEWLEAHGLVSADGHRSDKFVMLEAIANRARTGEMDAVSWLDERGLIELPSILDATDEG